MKFPPNHHLQSRVLKFPGRVKFEIPMQNLGKQAESTVLDVYLWFKTNQMKKFHRSSEKSPWEEIWSIFFPVAPGNDLVL